MKALDHDSPEQKLFRDTVRRFVTDELRPRARDFDEMGCFDRELYPRMGDLGLLGLRYDEAYGGMELDWHYSAILHEELGRADNAGVALGIAVHTDMATPSLHRFGTAELKDKFLKPAIDGHQIAAVAVTEPDAGSDVAGGKTRAVRDGDEWVINGSKIYITNASTADWICLLAVTDPDAGHSGFSQIIVPTKSDGFSFQLLDKIGNWGSDTAQIFFDDVRVPVTNTIGEVGRGFQQQMMQFQDERLVIAVAAIAQVEQVWHDTKEWCEGRKLFGTTLAAMQNTKFKMVEMWTDITVAKQMIRACVQQLAAGHDATELITMAKIHCARVSRRVADDCLQLHGGMGYMKESSAARAFVDVRLHSIGGGTDETMLYYLARQMGL